jgi:hypothetical protein
MNPLMKCLACLVVSAAAALGSSVGDTYDQVLREKGEPKSRIEAGAMRVLTYPDAVIKLKDNVVVSIRATAAAPRKDSGAPAAAAAAAPSPSSAAALTQQAQINKILKQMSVAVKRVQEIVNQEVPSVPLDPKLKLWEFFFHEGATMPDFTTVDVRTTQETPYDAHEYIRWQGRPDVMWAAKDLEFNSMTKYFYLDRTLPKKKLTEAEMLEINKLYRVIGQCVVELNMLGYNAPVQ